METLPIIDFSEFEKDPFKVSSQVLEACKSIGFFYMLHHGIPQAQVDGAFAMAKEYFDEPLEEKQKYNIQSNNHGYSGLYSEKLDPEHQHKGDHKEAFNFKNFVDGVTAAPLPPYFASKQESVMEFSYACHRTALRVLEAFAIALEVRGRYWFKDRHAYHSTSGQILRMIKYPKGGEKDYQASVRTGAHSDYGSLTLLFQKDIPGLEVQLNGSQWISAPIVENAVLVNVGDLMEAWTNGLFKSTVHRVVFLPEHQHLDRYSIPFFVHPENSVLLKPIPSKIVPFVEKEKLITASEHLTNRLHATYGF
ncbi:hypothetical protein BDF14DRAFT_1731206 [Spinellus fusiger]|nr:hypothetical protein BDF14DRAFT_1731206 [Spinellus fusiger]